MTDETVECFNCGHANPAWAQVCRNCGVPLRPGVAHTAPSGRFPTDRDSLISLIAAIGAIAAAVVVGLFLANISPSTPTVGLVSPSPRSSLIARSSLPPEATPAPAATPTPAPTPVPLSGTLAFGAGVDGAGNLTGKTTTFGPGSTFAHLITNSAAFGTNQIGEGVVQIAADGKESLVVDPAQNTLPVSPSAKKAIFGPIATDTLRNALGGPGKYRMEVFLGKKKIAQGVFTLTGG
ncbi:MAG: zinc ribbon domain-containing protein [Chloroflexota bacterium]|nr:zinc ribbon domain-containing protein [Chloroflexota bacterium]